MAPKHGNLFDGIASGSLEEQLSELVTTPGVRIERIVSTGQTTPSGTWLVQDRSEWVLLVSGAAALEFEGEAKPRQLKPGDYLMIPPHCRHRVTWTEQGPHTIWLAVHYDGV